MSWSTGSSSFLFFPLAWLLTWRSYDHQQFAYHETSFFLIRLLQQFTGFSLAPEAQPVGTRPPESWAGCVGSKGSTKVWPGLHLTMYVRVSYCSLCFAPYAFDASELGRVDFGSGWRSWSLKVALNQELWCYNNSVNLRFCNILIKYLFLQVSGFFQSGVNETVLRKW